MAQKIVTLDALAAYHQRMKADRMAKDGSNYEAGLQLVTPVITSSWKVKTQDGTAKETLTGNVITVENGAKVDYSGSSSAPAPSAAQVAPTAVSGDFGTAAAGSKTAADITANTTFRVNFSAPKGGLEVSGNRVIRATGNQNTSATASVAFSHRRFYGTSADANADITTLQSELNNTRAKTLNFDCTGGKYFFYAYPKALGASTWKVGGLAFTGYTQTEKTITNEYGLAVTYLVYRSAEPQTGAAINTVIA